MSLLRTAQASPGRQRTGKVSSLRAKFENLSISQSHSFRSNSIRASSAATTNTDTEATGTPPHIRAESITTSGEQSIDSYLRGLSGSSSSSSFSVSRAFHAVKRNKIQKRVGNTAIDTPPLLEVQASSVSSKTSKKVSLGGNLQMDFNLTVPIDRVHVQSGQVSSTTKQETVLDKKSKKAAYAKAQKMLAKLDEQHMIKVAKVKQLKLEKVKRASQTKPITSKPGKVKVVTVTQISEDTSTIGNSQESTKLTSDAIAKPNQKERLLARLEKMGLRPFDVAPALPKVEEPPSIQSSIYTSGTGKDPDGRNASSYGSQDPSGFVISYNPDDATSGSGSSSKSNVENDDPISPRSERTPKSTNRSTGRIMTFDDDESSHPHSDASRSRSIASPQLRPDAGSFDFRQMQKVHHSFTRDDNGVQHRSFSHVGNVYQQSSAFESREEAFHPGSFENRDEDESNHHSLRLDDSNDPKRASFQEFQTFSTVLPSLDDTGFADSRRQRIETIKSFDLSVHVVSDGGEDFEAIHVDETNPFEEDDLNILSWQEDHIYSTVGVNNSHSIDDFDAHRVNQMSRFHEDEDEDTCNRYDRYAIDANETLEDSDVQLEDRALLPDTVRPTQSSKDFAFGMEEFFNLAANRLGGSGDPKVPSNFSFDGMIDFAAGRLSSASKGSDNMSANEILSIRSQAQDVNKLTIPQHRMTDGLFQGPETRDARTQASFNNQFSTEQTASSSKRVLDQGLSLQPMQANRSESDYSEDNSWNIDHDEEEVFIDLDIDEATVSETSRQEKIHHLETHSLIKESSPKTEPPLAKEVGTIFTNADSPRTATSQQSLLAASKMFERPMLKSRLQLKDTISPAPPIHAFNHPIPVQMSPGRSLFDDLSNSMAPSSLSDGNSILTKDDVPDCELGASGMGPSSPDGDLNNNKNILTGKMILPMSTDNDPAVNQLSPKLADIPFLQKEEKSPSTVDQFPNNPLVSDSAPQSNVTVESVCKESEANDGVLHAPEVCLNDDDEYWDTLSTIDTESVIRGQKNYEEVTQDMGAEMRPRPTATESSVEVEGGCICPWNEHLLLPKDHPDYKGPQRTENDIVLNNSAEIFDENIPFEITYRQDIDGIENLKKDDQPSPVSENFSASLGNLRSILTASSSSSSTRSSNGNSANRSSNNYDNSLRTSSGDLIVGDAGSDLKKAIKRGEDQAFVDSPRLPEQALVFDDPPGPQNEMIDLNSNENDALLEDGPPSLPLLLDLETSFEEDLDTSRKENGNITNNDASAKLNELDEQEEAQESDVAYPLNDTFVMQDNIKVQDSAPSFHSCEDNLQELVENRTDGGMYTDPSHTITQTFSNDKINDDFIFSFEDDENSENTNALLLALSRSNDRTDCIYPVETSFDDSMSDPQPGSIDMYLEATTSDLRTADDSQVAVGGSPVRRKMKESAGVPAEDSSGFDLLGVDRTEECDVSEVLINEATSESQKQTRAEKTLSPTKERPPSPEVCLKPMVARDEPTLPTLPTLKEVPSSTISSSQEILPSQALSISPLDLLMEEAELILSKGLSRPNPRPVERIAGTHENRINEDMLRSSKQKSIQGYSVSLSKIKPSAVMRVDVPAFFCSSMTIDDSSYVSAKASSRNSRPSQERSDGEALSGMNDPSGIVSRSSSPEKARFPSPEKAPKRSFQAENQRPPSPEKEGRNLFPVKRPRLPSPFNNERPPSPEKARCLSPENSPEKEGRNLSPVNRPRLPSPSNNERPPSPEKARCLSPEKLLRLPSATKNERPPSPEKVRLPSPENPARLRSSTEMERPFSPEVARFGSPEMLIRRKKLSQSGQPSPEKTGVPSSEKSRRLYSGSKVERIPSPEKLRKSSSQLNKREKQRYPSPGIESRANSRLNPRSPHKHRPCPEERYSSKAKQAKEEHTRQSTESSGEDTAILFSKSHPSMDTADLAPSYSFEIDENGRKKLGRSPRLQFVLERMELRKQERLSRQRQSKDTPSMKETLEEYDTILDQLVRQNNILKRGGKASESSLGSNSEVIIGRILDLREKKEKALKAIEQNADAFHDVTLAQEGPLVDEHHAPFSEESVADSRSIDSSRSSVTRMETRLRFRAEHLSPHPTTSPISLSKPPRPEDPANSRSPARSRSAPHARNSSEKSEHYSHTTKRLLSETITKNGRRPSFTQSFKREDRHHQPTASPNEVHGLLENKYQRLAQGMFHGHTFESTLDENDQDRKPTSEKRSFPQKIERPGSERCKMDTEKNIQQSPFRATASTLVSKTPYMDLWLRENPRDRNTPDARDPSPALRDSPRSRARLDCENPKAQGYTENRHFRQQQHQQQLQQGGGGDPKALHSFKLSEGRQTVEQKYLNNPLRPPPAGTQESHPRTDRLMSSLFSPKEEQKQYNSAPRHRPDSIQELNPISDRPISSPERRRLLGSYISDQTNQLKRNMDLARLSSHKIRKTNVVLSSELEAFKLKLSQHARSKQGERAILGACQLELGGFQQRLQESRRQGLEARNDSFMSDITLESAWEDFSEIRGAMLTNLRIMHDAQERLMRERFRIQEHDEGDAERLMEIQNLMAAIERQEKYDSNMVRMALEEADRLN